MARRDRESTYDSEPHGGLFFDDEYDEHEDFAGAAPERSRPSPRATATLGHSRVETRQLSRHRTKRRFLGGLGILLVIVLVVSVWFIGLPIYHYLFPKDYDGNGTGTVVVTVRANDNTSQIGRTLADRGVVGSERAFTDVAENDDRARSIQPGSYQLHRHMSAKSALALILDPSSRIDSDTVVTEGATIVDVEKRLTAPSCTSSPAGSNGCGPGLDESDVTKGLTDVKALGIPTDYLDNGKTPASVEGFLYPATYTFDDETSVTDALQQMVGKFTDQARSTRFSTKAKALGLTPYQALVVASIAQGEAKFAADMPKVARVILNRLKADRALQVDATSAYAAKLKGLDPTEEIYAQTKGPFNTYNHTGLPPTPIGNPGEAAMTGAAGPAKGDWLFYVNKDKAGHLGFYTDEKSFIKAAQKCHDEGWGCAAP